MVSAMETRREFLGMAAAGLALLAEARAAFAAALQDVGDLNDAYDVSDGVTYLNHASIGTTTLCEEHGIVLRPFAIEGRELLRVSPNVANDRDDIDRLITALGRLLA
jgi:selenocysteine lyase/cysteine desulfurase